MRCWIIICLVLLGCGKQSDTTIRIAAASNTQFALHDIIQAFESEHHIQCEMSIASSGKLTAQIISGAPYHIFLSANRMYPDKIREANLSSNQARTYAFGNLAIWTAMQDIKASLDLLTDQNIRFIALPNPELAPYGIAAMEVINSLHIYDEVVDKFVIGESISQTNQFINTNNADIGFTAVSTFMHKNNAHINGNWEKVPENLYSQINQEAIITKAGGGNPEVRLFFDFLFSDEAKKIFLKHGYSVPD